LADSAIERALAIAERDPEALLAFVGPTASGKTALAVSVAERVGGEIVSADSVQIYRGFDIGSGKPTAEELARAPHRLVSVLDPLDAVDAARFADLATCEIEDIREQGRRPILCGGSFLWVKALVFGLAEAPTASQEVRGRHRAIVQSEGRAALHAKLATLDPASAARLHPNDVVRVSRALEVLEVSGKPMSAWQSEHAWSKGRHRVRLVAIRRDPRELTARIETRAAAWLGGGWIDEVASLVEQGYGEARAMGSVGYREVRAHLAGKLAHAELEGAIVRSTRIFARRQRTWLNHTDVEWLEPDLARAPASLP
jgi:tRNA dimethylallyltransferase